MLTRFVRIQLAVFTIVRTSWRDRDGSLLHPAPTLLGIGRMTVTLELPATGGLYQFPTSPTAGFRWARSPRWG